MTRRACGAAGQRLFLVGALVFFWLFSLAGFDARAQTTGPVAAYAFNEGAGTTLGDASGNGNTGTLQGPTWTAAGKYGAALSFDGINDLVVVNPSNSLNLSTAMTLEAWVFPTAAQSGWRTIVQREVDAFTFNASNINGALHPAGGGTFDGQLDHTASPSALAVNAWSHVALTWDGATLRLYVNGTQVSSKPRTGTLQTSANGAGPIRIGGNVPYGEFFQGLIDELRIYNRGLSAAEIQSDMNTPIATGPAGSDTTPPSNPTGLSAPAVSATQIDLSWTASTDNVGVAGYQLERCQGAGCTTFIQIATPTSTTFSNTGLTASTSYSYRVRATDAAGNLSGYSAVASATTSSTPDTTPPTAPSGLTPTAVSATQINLSWTAPTDNVGVTGYRLERCQGTGCTTFTEIASPTSTTFSNTGLTASTSYSYRVRATDAAGNLSGYSAVASATTSSNPDTTPPTAPSGLTPTAVSAAQINLSWTAPTDNVGVTGYRLERCQGTGCTTFTEIASPTSTTFSNTGLTASTSYSYRVRAADAAGNLSAYSSVATATTGASTGASSTGLVAAYAFNEGAGTTVGDASGNGNTGTISGATWTAAGKFGAALAFDGVSDLVQINASASLNPSTAITVEAWVFPTAAQSGWRTIVQREVDAFTFNASNIDGALHPAGGGTFDGQLDHTASPSALAVNAWSHVALTWDGATLRLYVNGAQVSSKPRTGTLQTSANGAGPIRIGGNVPYGEFFQGLIDELRIYNRALSAAEVESDMNAPVASTAPAVPTVSLAANPTSVASGGSSTLTWSSTDATSCTASGGWSGTKATSGSQSTGTLTASGNFTLTCTGAGGSASASATVTVTAAPPAPTASLTANPTSVPSGGSSTLTWSTTDASSCTASGGWSGTKATSGSQSTGALTASTDFLLTCTGAGGSASVSARVTVTGGTPVPTVSLTANPTSVASGGASTLTWSSTNATSCTASGDWSGTKATSGSQSTGALTASGNFTLTCTGAGGSASASATVTLTGPSFGLEFPGNGAVRRMLFWNNPFPIYDATYVFRVFPRKKTVPSNSPTGYYTTFFWGNNGTFIWDNGNGNTYYGAHPYPIPAPNGPGQWEISVNSNDYVTGSEVVWDRWYTQAFRAWRESPSVTHHEFYWDLPDTSKVITQTVVDPHWAAVNPPSPAIVMGQAPNLNGASWGTYPGWEEFNGIIRGIQLYSGLLSLADIQAEIANPMSTTAGKNLIWYLNVNPRPSDVTDKKGVGTPHNPAWDGTTALEWTE